MPDRIFIATAWPYANGPLHLGHIAGCYLPADIFARYHRLVGNDVLMVSGSDAHGTPITLRAEADGVSPEVIVKKYHDSFMDSWRRLGITFDLFTTTVTDKHREVVHDVFNTLYEKGFIYPGIMKVAYSPDFDRFLPDRYVEGKCPHCSNLRARGDQCDECGRTLDPIDLIDPVYRHLGGLHSVEIRDTEHLFLKLSQFQQQLLEWLEPKKHWRPNVRNFTRSFLEEGLKDRAITRDLNWGIPVPLPGFEDKRIYVWFEAVTGYLSASKAWAESSGDPDAWRPYWEDPDTKAYYFIGKDNIPFHTIIWPAILLGYGDVNLPYDVPANEFLTLEKQQLSTSRNWAVWVPDYLDRFPPDPLRYALSASMPESSDADFSWGEYIRRNNDELVATFGNLVHRVLTLVNRYFDGQVPQVDELRSVDEAMLDKVTAAFVAVGASLEACRFREALGSAMSLARDANRYLDNQAPWHQVKDDVPAAARTLYTSLTVISGLKTLLYPFIPFTSERLHSLLGGTGDLQKDGWVLVNLSAGTNLPKPVPLFTKLDESVADEQLERFS